MVLQPILFKSPEMVKGALFIANMGSVFTDIPATSSATLLFQNYQ